MTSVCENNRDENITFHVLTDGISKKNKMRLEHVAFAYNKQILIYSVDKAILKDCPVRVGDHVSLATYFRILMPSILPSPLDKVLYFDCDIVVRKSLAALWATDITHNPIGAVYDMAIDDIRNYNRLRYDRALGYFNAGVLLVNLKYWRDNNVSNKIIQYINRYPERLQYWDQDALNGVLIKDLLALPFKYNMQTFFFLKDPMLRIDFINEIENDIKDPVILHFSTSCKPWLKGLYSPAKSEYFKYLALSLWKKYKPAFPPGRWTVCLRYYLIKIGLLSDSYKDRFRDDITY
ncbi:LPS 1,2-glucosyltransferase [Spirochaetia bacterium]|nr:LPS 1,2-glucosyltransferase [Spirochaetia bacterium]